MEVRKGFEISVLKANWQPHTANSMVRADLSMSILQDKVDIQDRIWTHSLGRYSAFFWCGIEPRPSIQPIASIVTHRVIAVLGLEKRPVIWKGNEGRGLRSRYLKLRRVLLRGLAPHILNTRSDLATSFSSFSHISHQIIWAMFLKWLLLPKSNLWPLPIQHYKCLHCLLKHR